MANEGAVGEDSRQSVANLKKAILLFDKYGFLDPTSSAFHQALAETVDEVHLVNLATLDVYSESVSKQILHAISKFDVKFCVTINGVGMGSELFNTLRRLSIPIISWYWDTPAAEADKMSGLNEVSEIFFGCQEYSKFPGFNGRGEFLPFAGTEPMLTSRTPDKGIVFLGSCWHVARIMQKVALGLVSRLDGKKHSIGQIYELIRSDRFIEHQWETVSGEAMPSWEILNAFSAIKRLQHLSNLMDFDLNVFGGIDWLINSAATAPEITKVFQQKLIRTKSEMHDLMTQHKVSLNIFHLQNQNGGPNFRVFDSVVHGVPLLSDFNSHCAQIFPHEDAALYYRNPSELRDYAKALVEDGGLRKKMVNRSREILLDSHLHQHRVQRFWKGIGKYSVRGEKVIKYFDANGNLNTYLEDSGNPWVTDNHAVNGRIEDTEMYKTEKYWAESHLFMQWEIKDRAEKISNLEAQIEKLQRYSLFAKAKKVKSKLKAMIN